MNENITVLLVDDDPVGLERTATELERASDVVETVRAAGAERGLGVLRDGGDGVDCVVSEYDMAGTDGLGLLAAVRERDSTLPFVLFTASGSETVASEAIAAGASDYVPKVAADGQYAALADRLETLVAERRAREEATEATRQIRRMFQRITDGFCALDDEMYVTYVNEQAAAFAERDRDDLLGEHVSEMMRADRVDDYLKAYSRAFEAQESVAFEAESASRADRWIAERVYPSEDGLSIYFRDVTERKRVESELRETKEKIEELHDIASQAVACETEAEIFELTVGAAEEILAFDICGVDTVEDGVLVPRAVSSDTPPDGYYEGTPVDAEENLAARTYRTGESYLVDDLGAEDVEPAARTYRSAISVPFGDGGVFQAVSREPDGFDEDDLELAELLTTHLTGAVRRVRTERELRAERDRFAALFENVPNPAINYVYEDDEPVVTEANPAFERVFGWSADTVVGQSIDEFILPSGRAAEATELNQRIRNGERIDGVEVRRQTADGRRDFLFHTVPVRAGDRTEGFSIYTDISAQKRRERELTRQNERLDEFAEVISHDLLNPLSVLQGRVELLGEEIESAHLAPIDRAIDRMQAMLEDVLALARQGQVVNETSRVPLRTVVDGAWATTVTEGHDLTVADDLPTVEADQGRLRELLENLFRNAVEHGGADAEVRVGPLSDGGFYVADDGAGIPETDREHLFESGFTTTESGTGLGLSIVESIVDAHGWTISVGESAAGGARFEIHV